MNTFKLFDTFDTAAAKTLLYSGRLNDLDAQKLRAFYLRGRANAAVQVEYFEEPGTPAIGRLKSRVPGKNGAFVPHFMCGIPGDVRRCISGSLVHDVDIQCCHPTLLLKITKDLGLPCTRLESYVKDCKDWRKMVALDCNVPEETAKKLFNQMLYGGDYHSWAKEHKVDPETVRAAIKAFQCELEDNRAKILVGYPECVAHQKTAKPDHWNPEASAMFFVLAQAEKQCLLAMKQSFERKGYEVRTLMHDGLTVGRRQEPVLEPGLLRAVERDILKATAYEVKLVEKPMESTLLEGVQVIPVENDDEAADQFLDHHQEQIQQDVGRTFVLEDGLWNSDPKVVQRAMLKMCLAVDIVKEVGDKEYQSYSKEVPCARRIIEAATAKLPMNRGFANALFDSNLGKLVFKDGVYDFATRTFGPDPNVKTCVRIEREFPKERDPDMIQMVYDRVLNVILPNEDRRRYFLQYCARAMAGHIEDKKWGTCIGDRNSGKGVLVLAFQQAFGDYIGAFNAENFMYKTNIGDAAKDKSWMIDHEFKRLIFSNECMIDNEKGTKLNGNMIKNFSGGGDVMVARKNFRDEVEFRVQSRLMLMVNDLPPIKPADTFETMVKFTFESVFVPEERLNAHSIECYRLADPAIKAWIRSDPRVRDAFLHIVLDHYEATEPRVPQVVAEDTKEWNEDDTFSAEVAKLYEITGSKDDFIPTTKVSEDLKKPTNMGRNKIAMELRKLGVVKEKRWCKRLKKDSWSYVGMKELESEAMFLEDSKDRDL